MCRRSRALTRFLYDAQSGRRTLQQSFCPHLNINIRQSNGYIPSHHLHQSVMIYHELSTSLIFACERRLVQFRKFAFEFTLKLTRRTSHPSGLQNLDSVHAMRRRLPAASLINPHARLPRSTAHN